MNLWETFAIAVNDARVHTGDKAREMLELYLLEYRPVW